MSTTALIAGAAVWRKRLDHVQGRLAEIAAAFGERHFDWAPDVGIESARQILWSLASRQRVLAARLEGRESSSEPSAANVSPAEIMALLDATHGRLLDFIDSTDDDDACADSIFEHLLALTEGAAKMRALLELIDPDRKLPRPVAPALS